MCYPKSAILQCGSIPANFTLDEAKYRMQFKLESELIWQLNLPSMFNMLFKHKYNAKSNFSNIYFLRVQKQKPPPPPSATVIVFPWSPENKIQLLVNDIESKQVLFFIYKTAYVTLTFDPCIILLLLLPGRPGGNYRDKIWNT